MGKRTLRTLHFDLVAGVLQCERRNAATIYEPGQYREGALVSLRRVALAFADEFEIRAEGFQREKFLKACGLEGK